MADRLSKINGIVEYEAIHKDRLSKISGVVEYEPVHKDRLSKMVAMIEYVDVEVSSTSAYLRGTASASSSLPRPDYNDVEVSGAGTSATNGIYSFSVIDNGKPRYTKGDYYIYWEDAEGDWPFEQYWYIMKIGSPPLYYRSVEGDDVATPDLVTTWIKVAGDDPVPTVTEKPIIVIYLNGCLSASSQAPAYLRGTITTTSSLPRPDYGDIRVSGAGTSAVNGVYVYSGIELGKPYYTCGANTIIWGYELGSYWWAIIAEGLKYFSSDAVDTPDLVTTWEKTVTADYPVPIVTGKPVIYTRGSLSTSSQIVSYLYGAISSSTISSSTSAYLSGGSDRISTIGANVEYQDTFADRISTIGASIEYQDTFADRISAIGVQVEYRSIYRSSVPCFLFGVESALDSTPVYLFGGMAASDSISAYLSGPPGVTSAIDAYLHGRESTTDELSAYLHGKTTITDSISAYLSGQTSTLTSQDAFIHGSQNVLDSQPAYISVISAYPASDSNPCYLHGKLDTTDNIGAYLNGSINIDTAIPAFVQGQADVNSAISAYTNALWILAGPSSIHAYLSTDTFISASTPAYIVSLTDSPTSSKPAYMNGISRSNISCYLNGGFVSVNYINLKTSDGTLSKRFMVLAQDYDNGVFEKGESVVKTVGGGIDHSIGSVYTMWSMIIRVPAEEPRPNYGDRDDLEYFYDLNSPKGTPSSIITFTDHYQYKHYVKMIGSLKKNLISTIIEGQTAIYLYRLQLIEVS